MTRGSSTNEAKNVRDGQQEHPGRRIGAQHGMRFARRGLPKGELARNNIQDRVNGVCDYIIDRKGEGELLYARYNILTEKGKGNYLMPGTIILDELVCQRAADIITGINIPRTS